MWLCDRELAECHQRCGNIGHGVVGRVELFEDREQTAESFEEQLADKTAFVSEQLIDRGRRSVRQCGNPPGRHRRNAVVRQYLEHEIEGNGWV
jgi:hypothetical protein